MDLTLFKEGFFVMVIGMGTVFVFLTVMICAMNINGKVLHIVNKFFPEEIPAEKKPARKESQNNNNEEIALAIACAMAASGKKLTA